MKKIILFLAVLVLTFGVRAQQAQLLTTNDVRLAPIQVPVITTTITTNFQRGWRTNTVTRAFVPPLVWNGVAADNVTAQLLRMTNTDGTKIFPGGGFLTNGAFLGISFTTTNGTKTVTARLLTK